MIVYMGVHECMHVCAYNIMMCVLYASIYTTICELSSSRRVSIRQI